MLSNERSKMHDELISTEDKILHEIQNKGPFKALPLNKKLFGPRKQANEKSLSRLESTKFKEFNLSAAAMSR